MSLHTAIGIATVVDMADSNYYPKGAKLPIGEVARMFGVTVATVRNWEKQGRVEAERTPGGQRRFAIEEVERLKREAA